MICCELLAGYQRQKSLRILEACHDDRVGGCHFGRDRTIDKVTARYYWEGIYRDTEEWVSTRLNCIVVCWLAEMSCNIVHVEMLPMYFTSLEISHCLGETL